MAGINSIASVWKQANQGSSNKATTAKSNISPQTEIASLRDAVSNMDTRINEAASTLNEFRNYGNYIDYATTAQQAANAFNAAEAEKQRQWTESMSSTAHQREVADLKAAGLNPILSVNAGAPVGSGSAASTDNALTSVFGALASQAMSAVSNMSQSLASNATSFASSAMSQHASMYSADLSKYAADLSSKTSISVAQATNEMNYKIAQLNSLTSQQVAEIAGRYNLSSAQVSAFASKYASQLAYDANMYAANKSSDTALQTAKMNNETSNMNTFEGVLGQLCGDLIGLVGRGRK